MPPDPAERPSAPQNGDCNITDGFSVCTNTPGHGPVHWDRRTQHEWYDATGCPGLIRAAW